MLTVAILLLGGLSPDYQSSKMVSIKKKTTTTRNSVVYAMQFFCVWTAITGLQNDMKYSLVFMGAYERHTFIKSFHTHYIYTRILIVWTNIKSCPIMHIGN